MTNPVWIGDALLWSAESVPVSQIWTWTESAGPKPLVSFANDLTRGAANVFTDGVDLVWLQGEERDPKVSEFYPKRSVMTAKFTTDAIALKPVRVRSWPDEFIWGNDTPNAVGCGYAALRAPSTPGDLQLVIIGCRTASPGRSTAPRTTTGSGVCPWP